MPIHDFYITKVTALCDTYQKLKQGKESLLRIIDEAELSEQIYNSNAIENSTLTLFETERILLEMEVSRNISIREIFEAKNLARVMQYLGNLPEKKILDTEMICFIHQMLLMNISDDIAGRFRQENEYVRVGTYIAPDPIKVPYLILNTLEDFNASNAYFLDAIAQFHLAFESIHPFNDGNGRIGRVLINYLLSLKGLPPIIIRNSEKQSYYSAFKEYQQGNKQATAAMEKVLLLGFLESLNKRITYLQASTIIPLAQYAREHKRPLNNLSNMAKRQTIPAFREQGVWKIAESFVLTS